MGWGKALSAVIVMSISVMLVVSVLPVGADHEAAHKGKCSGKWASISYLEAMDRFGVNPISHDGNDNGYVCWKTNGSGALQFKDDRPIK